MARMRLAHPSKQLDGHLGLLKVWGNKGRKRKRADMRPKVQTPIGVRCSKSSSPVRPESVGSLVYAGLVCGTAERLAPDRASKASQKAGND